MESKVKDRQALKRAKPEDVKPEVSVQYRLGPRHKNSSRYDYTPLRILRTEILREVESLGILHPLVKMMSPIDKRNPTKFSQFH